MKWKRNGKKQKNVLLVIKGEQKEKNSKKGEKMLHGSRFLLMELKNRKIVKSHRKSTKM